MKTHKKTKASRHRGKNQGSCGHGARKKAKKSGHHGGGGMSGSGKRADHKKTLVTKLYGNNYFGKQGITSRGTKRDTRQRIGLAQIQSNLAGFLKKGLAKKTAKGYEINLGTYKILSEGTIKEKLFIKASGASKVALEKVKAAGGEIILPVAKVKEVKKVTEKKKDKKE